jgi:hypothetical protein
MSVNLGIQSGHVDATGVVVSTGGVYLKGYQFLSGGTAGEIVVRDGGASGTIKIRFNIPANTNNPVYALLPDPGMMFDTNIHVTLPTSACFTTFHSN